MILSRIQADLWVHRVPYRVGGLLEFGRQLVVVRLPGGALWIHSPVPWTPALRTTIAALGQVGHVVAPNLHHDECLASFQREYPAALFHATPGLATLHPRIRFDRTLGGAPDPAWAGALDQHFIQGMPGLGEFLFLHRASRTLILTDLAFNLGPEGPFLTRVLMRLNGAWGKFGPSRYCRSLIADRAALRRSLDHVLAWDFDRIIVGHGANLETDGKAALRAAFSFLG